MAHMKAKLIPKKVLLPTESSMKMEQRFSQLQNNVAQRQLIK